MRAVRYYNFRFYAPSWTRWPLRLGVLVLSRLAAGVLAVLTLGMVRVDVLVLLTDADDDELRRREVAP